MIHDVVVLSYLVLCGPITPGVDDIFFQRWIDSLGSNCNGGFHSRYDVEGGLDWLHLTKYIMIKMHYSDRFLVGYNVVKSVCSARDWG